MILKTATHGIVNPILANAEPNARLRLVCSLFFFEAMIAAIPSGRRIIVAIITPTSTLGRLWLTMIFSIDGDNVLAGRTTTAMLMNRNTMLVMKTRLLIFTPDEFSMF